MTYFYDYSPPRRVKGGIRARASRKGLKSSWWTRRWMETIDSFDIGERASRGRTYARKGQVKSLNISKGRVTASVQGSSWEPYDVEIRIDTVPESAWKSLAEALFVRPGTASKLLAGTMPDDIEKAFKVVGADLFPKRSDLKTGCTCPDWSNPCKHIVAVLFLLGEEFERDPFLIFRLRGSKREDLLRMAGLKSVPGPEQKGRRQGKASPSGQSPDASPKPLPANPDKFWGRNLDAFDPGDVFVPKVHAVLPKQLGSFPFWRGSDDFIRTMEGIYKDASQAGVKAFLGEADGDDQK